MPQLILRVILGGLFILAAYLKLRDPQAFVESVMAFKIFAGKPLPDRLAQLATFVVPWVELLCGVFLVLGLWTRAAGALLACLIAAFIIALTLVVVSGKPVECGCFGKFEIPCGKKVGPCHLVRNTVLLAMAIALWVMGGGRFSLDGRSCEGRAGR